MMAMLDEPHTSLDPAGLEVLASALRRLAQPAAAA